MQIGHFASEAEVIQQAITLWQILEKNTKAVSEPLHEGVTPRTSPVTKDFKAWIKQAPEGLDELIRRDPTPARIIDL